MDKEIEDALAMWEYVKSLPYVTKIGLLGHSQGGVVASMTAGILSVFAAQLIIHLPTNCHQRLSPDTNAYDADYSPLIHMAHFVTYCLIINFK